PAHAAYVAVATTFRLHVDATAARHAWHCALMANGMVFAETAQPRLRIVAYARRRIVRKHDALCPRQLAKAEFHIVFKAFGVACVVVLICHVVQAATVTEGVHPYLALSKMQGLGHAAALLDDLLEAFVVGTLELAK